MEEKHFEAERNEKAESLGDNKKVTSDFIKFEGGKKPIGKAPHPNSIRLYKPSKFQTRSSSENDQSKNNCTETPDSDETADIGKTHNLKLLLNSKNIKIVIFE